MPLRLDPLDRLSWLGPQIAGLAALAVGQGYYLAVPPSTVFAATRRRADEVGPRGHR